MNLFPFVEPVAGLLGVVSSAALQRLRPFAKRLVSHRERVVDIASILLAMAVSVLVRACAGQSPDLGVRPVRMAAAVVAFDLWLYLLHRFNHTRAGWAMHKVHHAPTHFDVGMAMRGSLLYLVLFSASLNLISFALGLSFAETTLVSALFFAWQWWIHANVWLPLGVLDLVLMSPRHHALHHTRGGFGRNFGGFLCLWDQLGGTWLRPPERPADLKFGLGDGASTPREWLGV